MQTPSYRDVPDGPLATAAALGPEIKAVAGDTERSRRISPELLASLRNAGLFRMWLPHEVGGSATDLPTILAVFEEIARHDGSTGWVTMIGSGTNLLLTALPPDVVHEVFSPDPDIATGGFLVPRGRAVQVEGGYRVSGRWPFGSGCEHCNWLIGGCVVLNGGEPALDGEGRPVTRMMLFSRDEVIIHDTWNVSGLRGTGSHDYEVKDLLVPAKHSFQLSGDRTYYPFAHARMPLWGMLAVSLASVVLGIARGAIDALTEYARTQRLGGKLVKDQPLIQARVAEAEGLVRAARAFVFSTTTDVWEKAVAGAPIAATDDLLLRLASSHAARACTEAVHLMFTAGGTAALYHDSSLQRFQRDIQAAQQHGLIAFYSFEGLGKELLEEGQNDAGDQA